VRAARRAGVHPQRPLDTVRIVPHTAVGRHSERVVASAVPGGTRLVVDHTTPRHCGGHSAYYVRQPPVDCGSPPQYNTGRLCAKPGGARCHQRREEALTMDPAVPRPDTIQALRWGADAAFAMLAGMQLDLFTA